MENECHPNNATPLFANFRFYEELNDFLPLQKRNQTFTYSFFGKPSIKDAIEAQGIPHTEVDLIIADGQSVGFEYHLRSGDFISVYPVFEGIDITPVVKLREKPLRNPKFILGKGKLGELSIYSLQEGATTWIFDQDLSPSQVKSLTGSTDLKIIDRTQLILDIFAQRARSREGKIQVELAQLQYLLPRLVGKNPALSRLACLR